jgi:hypothetical protein
MLAQGMALPLRLLKNKFDITECLNPWIAHVLSKMCSLLWTLPTSQPILDVESDKEAISSD